MYLLIHINTRYAFAEIGDKVEIINDSHYPVLLCRIGRMTFPVTEDELSITPVQRVKQEVKKKR